MTAGGALLPLGSDREHGGHKGYALALTVDVLCAVLSGANWGPFAPSFVLRWVPPARSVGKGIGHFFGAMRIDAFRDPGEFKAQIDDLVRTLAPDAAGAGHQRPAHPRRPRARGGEGARPERDPPPAPGGRASSAQISRQTGVPFE